MATYDVFISHSWSYSDRYWGVLGLLNTAVTNLDWFRYRNYSVPQHDPVVDPSEIVRIAKLTALLKEQIRQASCVIIPAGMYVNHRFWIQKEIDIAKNGFAFPKRLVGIRRRGQERTPVELESQCDVMVAWNSNSLANAVAGY
ncbi:MAG: nuclease [Alphaproteobacteria bacterium]|nr:MAG: nuclease [Alphaproteobacteria bacterium]